MLKYLFTALIIYVIYKYFISGPAQLDRRAPREEINRRAGTDHKITDADGEYVDYEEID